MGERFCEIFLGGHSCYTELLTDFLDRIAIEAMQQQSARLARWQLQQRALQLVELLLKGGLRFGALISICLKLCVEIRDIHCWRNGSLQYGMLVQNMTCDREEVGFGTTNGILILDTQKTEKHLLRKVGHIRSVAQAQRQETS